MSGQVEPTHVRGGSVGASLAPLLTTSAHAALAVAALAPDGINPVTVIDLSDSAGMMDLRIHGPIPTVVIGLAPDGTTADAVDVVASSVEDATAVLDAVVRNPHAAVALALLLRGSGDRTVTDGLIAESSTYSALQAGPEHRAWLDARTRRDRPDDANGRVQVRRAGDELRITLARPDRRNAFDARMREALLDALTVARADRTVRHVVLDGEGPTFCAGGDLDEFGTLHDPASAHLLRVSRSAGWALHTIAGVVEARVHGRCVGAGVELPAFAGRVVARSDATFRLPEVAMGLVPGAGGTVSITRRIGRQRLAWMALTGAEVDARTALAWGLVDELREPDQPWEP